MGGRRGRGNVPPEVAAILRGIEELLEAKDDTGGKPSNAKCGVYAFYDYDGEPIYVGQTKEQLRVRIRRHLTNQRTDAVAMNVLDPYEVAEVEMVPFYGLEEEREGESRSERLERVTNTLDAAEYTLYRRALATSRMKAVLNEKEIQPREPIELPPSLRRRIVPDEVFEVLKHPDTRISRRAQTIADLARVVSEREVSVGLRRTLLNQARRLEDLSRRRLEDTGGEGFIEGEEFSENGG